MAKKQTVQNQSGFPILGWLVNWSAKGMKITRPQLVAALNQVKIDDSIASEVIPKNAAIRAVRNVVESVHKGDLQKLRFKAADKEDVMVIIVAEVETDAQENAKVNQISKIIFNKTTRTVDVQGLYKSEIETFFDENKKTYASDQFRNIVLRYVKRSCAAITYLDTGNIYFVPASKEEELKKVQQLFNILKVQGHECTIRAKEEISTEQVKATMWSVVVQELGGEVEKMVEDFDQLDDDISPVSLQVRLNRYTNLKTRIDMFEVALSSTAEDLKAKLNTLNTKIQEKLVL